MEPIEKLNKWDLDCSYEPDGYDMKQVPKVSDGNVQKFMAKINELVEQVNKITEHLQCQNKFGSNI